MRNTFVQTVVKWAKTGTYFKMSVVFAALLVFEWIRCLQDWWWDETFAIVHGTLLAAVLTSLFVPRTAWRLVIQLCALIALNIAYSGYKWIPFIGEKKRAADWLVWAGANAGQLSPFIWIGLTVLVLFHAIVICRKRRSLIMTVVGASLVTLAVDDSLFTPIYLWQEIAWTVGIGLAWLVASHFTSFRQRHPDSWRQLTDYPASLFLPVLFIIALVMGAGLFVPSVKPLLTDPYTAWKEARGEAVPSLIGAKVDTTAVSGSEGDTRSGYSRNDSALGGGFRFDYSPVMTVTTTKRSYWRGETKAFYSGRGWQEASGEREEESVEMTALKQSLPTSGNASSDHVEKVEQTVEMVRKDRFPVLFGAGPISSVVSINGGDTVPYSMRWLPDSWELRLPRGAAYPKSYSLVSDVAVLDEAALRKAGNDDGAVNAMYLQLPESLPQRVRNLAAELTKGKATAYDKVLAIENYLQTNFQYTNEPDLSKKRSRDFVDSFLFEIKEGYCDYFSTAMAVLTRAADIPARWVKGYAPGSMPVDPEEMQMEGITGANINPDGAGTYTVRNADAHSWVEVYFDGYGWVPFEATAGFAYPYAMPEDEPAAIPDIQSAPDSTPSADPAEEPAIPRNDLIASFAGAVMLLIAAVVFLRRKAIAAVWRTWRRNSAGSPNERVVKETNRLLRYCRRKGLDREEHETVRESVLRWSARLTSLQNEFGAVLLSFEKALYSPDKLSEEEAIRFEAHVKSIRERIG
ncbi:transglutaminase TgpA family protein [Paenibacillus humicola]|uniref:transglutaminase TgpA family protein n=1 Tax=Paenibacillus humicola TaxID=3110540 RepID=UPI00237B68AA|nr:transglutaminase domain-containing protein [Paenibacillus humicola]